MTDIVFGIQLNADGSGLVGEVKLSKKELDKLSRGLKGVDDASDKAGRSTTEFERRQRRLATSARSLNQQLTSMRGIIASLGIFLVARDVLRTVTSFQSLRASLKTVTGSAALARVEFDRLKEFAATTPFQLEEVVQAFIKLTALGLQPSQEALRSYGNTAAAMSKSLDQFIEAVADASVGEFERLKEFGIKARVEGEQVAFTFQGTTTRVGRNAAEIEAFLRGIGEIEFAGAMEEQMMVLGGASSNLADAISQLFDEFGEQGVGDAAIGIVNALTDAIRGMIPHAGTLLSVLKTSTAIAAGYFAVFKIGPPAIATASGALALFTRQTASASAATAGMTATAARANTVLLGTSVAARLAAGSLTKLKVAGNVLFAAFAGFQIGTLLREQFVEARIAGLAFVGAILKGWEAIKFGFRVLVAGIRTLWVEMINSLRERFAEFIELVGSGLEKIPGLGDAAAFLDDVALSMRSAIADSQDFEAELARLRAEYAANKAGIDEIITDLVAYELQTANTTSAVKDNAAAEALAAAERAAAAAQAEAEKEALAEQQRIRQEFLASLESEIAMMGLSSDELQIQNALRQAHAAGITDQDDAIRQLIESRQAEIRQARNNDVAKALKQELELLKLTDRERAIEIELRKLSSDATNEQITAVRELAGALFDEAEAQREAEREARESTDGIAQIYEDTATSIRDSFRDSFRSIFDDGLDGFKDFGDRVLRIFKDLLADLLTLAIARPIIAPIVTTLGGVLGLQGNAMADVLGQLGIPSGGASGLGGILGASGALGGSPILQLLGAGVAGFGIGSSLGSLLGGTTGTSQVLSGVGAGIGALVGGPIGALLGGAAGGVLSGLFGGKTTVTGSGIILEIADGELSGQEFQDTKKRRSFFRGSRRRRNFSELDAELLDALQTQFAGTQDQLRALGLALGIDTSAADRFALASREINLTGLSEQEIEQAIAEFMAEVANELTEATFPGIEALRESGETAADALNRVAESILTMRGAALSLNDTITQLNRQFIDTPGEILEDLQAEFFDVLSQTESLTGDELIAAAGQLQALSGPLLEQARDIFASGGVFQNLFNEVTNALQLVSDRLDAEAEQLANQLGSAPPPPPPAHIVPPDIAFDRQFNDVLSNIAAQVNLTVITPDGRTLADDMFEIQREESSRGRAVVDLRGVAGLETPL